MHGRCCAALDGPPGKQTMGAWGLRSTCLHAIAASALRGPTGEEPIYLTACEAPGNPALKGGVLRSGSQPSAVCSAVSAHRHLAMAGCVYGGRNNGRVMHYIPSDVWEVEVGLEPSSGGLSTCKYLSDHDACQQVYLVWLCVALGAGGVSR